MKKMIVERTAPVFLRRLYKVNIRFVVCRIDQLLIRFQVQIFNSTLPNSTAN